MRIQRRRFLSFYQQGSSRLEGSFDSEVGITRHLFDISEVISPSPMPEKRTLDFLGNSKVYAGGEWVGVFFLSVVQVGLESYSVTAERVG